MDTHIDIQNVCSDTLPVTDTMITTWAKSALNNRIEAADLTIRIVDSAEITHLNATYRKKNKATNVLAFPANLPKEIAEQYPLLGDVIICPTVLKEESEKLAKPIEAHWAHIVIHGVLHLLGYDHIKESEAEIMQAVETQLLTDLGYPDPYYESLEGMELE
ncbi:metal dependent hydrolase [Legionella adelaidensis]|uniref:Endoribonuclease YbeY n=1 Tax=Legionella adelaidensis TaxID=45056 RepID=A0A0W0R5C3_9GAMM|nr:rRNA maturation RNase YbeY [Legionella adelaidensis]KTC66231.1 metal dependent hydrolase [Legionella adelaidensis]